MCEGKKYNPSFQISQQGKVFSKKTRQILHLYLFGRSLIGANFLKIPDLFLIIALHVMKFLTYLILMRVRSIGLMYFLMIMCYKSIFLYHIKKINFPLLFALG